MGSCSTHNANTITSNKDTMEKKSHLMRTSNTSLAARYTSNIFYYSVTYDRVHLYRNLYTIHYKKEHPNVTTAEFAKIWNDLSEDLKKVSTNYIIISIRLMLLTRHINNERWRNVLRKPKLHKIPCISQVRLSLWCDFSISVRKRFLLELLSYLISLHLILSKTHVVITTNPHGYLIHPHAMMSPLCHSSLDLWNSLDLLRHDTWLASPLPHSLTQPYVIVSISFH